MPAGRLRPSRSARGIAAAVRRSGSARPRAGRLADDVGGPATQPPAVLSQILALPTQLPGSAGAVGRSTGAHPAGGAVEDLPQVASHRRPQLVPDRIEPSPSLAELTLDALQPRGDRIQR